MDSALSDMTILDLGHGVSSSYCTKLLADFGADVIKIEAPEGDPLRRVGPFPKDAPDPEQSALFLHLNTNKQSVVLDLHCEAGLDAFRALAVHADAVVESWGSKGFVKLRHWLDELMLANPALVFTSLSHYGHEGLYRDHEATHLIHCATSGWMSMCGDPDREPLQCGGLISEYTAGLYGAIGTLAAISGSKSTGRGRRVQVSTQEAMQCLTIFGTQAYSETRTLRDRAANSSWSAQVLPCADGLIGCHRMAGRRWQEFCEWLERPDLAANPEFADVEDGAAVLSLMRNFVRERPANELFRSAQEHKLPFGLVPTIPELLDLDQHTARNFFVTVEHPVAGRLIHPGAPFRFSCTPAEPLRPAPILGEHSETILNAGAGKSSDELLLSDRAMASRSQNPQASRSQPNDTPNAHLPLAGVRILDATWVMAGPMATSLLADLGAEVIKVRSPDVSRADGFAAVNKNKYGITLDLNDPRGLEIFRRLVAVSDIVAENYTSRVMSGFGLSYEALRTIRPDLIMLSMPGYGATGPWKDYVSWAFPTEEMSGIAQLTGYYGGPPLIAGSGIGDPLAGLHGSVALLMALEYRRRTGRGQHIDVSQMEACTNLVGESILAYQLNGRVPERLGNRHPSMAPHGVYRCLGEDEWVAIAVRNDDDWRRLAGVIRVCSWENDARLTTAEGRRAHHDEIDAELEAWTKCRRPYTVMRMLQKAGIPAGQVMGPPDLLVDPHLRTVGAFQWLEQGDGGSWYPRQAIRLSGSDGEIRMGPPSIGEHNEKILNGLLGIPRDELDRLAAAGVIGSA